MRCSVWREILSLALIAAGSLRVYAQSVDSATKSPKQLPTAIVTASRAAIPAVTEATEVIGSAQLQALGAPHVADVLRSAVGLQVVQSGSFGGETTLYTRGGQSGYTRVLIDGVAVNNPGGDIDLSWLSVEDVDHIEIVRGPTSVLYGSDAVTGVVQIFTRTSAKRGAHVEASGGGFRTTDLRATVDVGDSVHFATISGQRYATAGIYAFNDGFTRNDLTASVRVPGIEGGRTHVLLKYSEAIVHIPTTGTGAVADKNAYQDTPRLLAAAQSRVIGKGFDATISLSTMMTGGGYNNAPDSPADTLGIFAFRSNDQIAIRTADIYASRKLGRHLMTLGATVEDETQHSSTYSNSQYGAANGALDAYRSTRSVYASLNGGIATTNWTLGARLDGNSAFGRFATYRAGVAQALGRFRVRGSAGSAFREPTFTENFATGFAVGNPRLRPELATSGDLGVDAQFQTVDANISVTAFEQQFQNLIEYTFKTSGPNDPNFKNIARAYSRGVELSASAAPISPLEVRIVATRLLTGVEEAGFDSSGTGYYAPGGRLLRRAGVTGAVSATYRLPHEGSAMVRWLAVGPRDDVDYSAGARAVLPSVRTMDASLRLAIPLSATRGFAVVRASNIANVEYEAVKGFRAPGRMVLAGVEISP